MNHAPKPISAKQINFIRTLLADREPGEALWDEAERVLCDGTSREASGIIDRLLHAPRPPREHDPNEAPEPEVAEGRYALPADFDPEGTPIFYEVDKGKDGGRWEGFTFLSKLVGPNEARIKDRDERNRILALIAENPTDALRRYGTLSGHCGNCGLELTDKFSRFIGVGPVCRAKLGLDKSEAEFVRKGGILPDAYVREVAAEEEAARAAAGEESLPFAEQAARRAINERADDGYRADGRSVDTTPGDLIALAGMLDRAAAARREGAAVQADEATFTGADGRAHLVGGEAA
jgi:Family of unknown function (DUF6011)